MTEAEALAALALADLTVTVVYEYDDTVPAGDVISMDPPAGTLVVPDQVVTLVVSLGFALGWFSSAANEAEAQKNRYLKFLAVDFDFLSGHVRVWTGYGVLTLFGEDYLGMGDLGHASESVERSNLTVERMRYQLSGTAVDPALVSEDDIDSSFGRPVVDYLGFLNIETHQLLGDPDVRFEGEISNILRRDGNEPSIEVNAESRMIMLHQSDGWRNTHEHQQQFYVGDLGFKEVPKQDMKEINWGGSRVVAGGFSHGPGETSPRLL